MKNRQKGGIFLKAGEWLDDRYRIIRPLGKGSEGSVYLAVQESTYKFYAVKELSKNGDFFSAESIALWKRLSHPGLPEISDILEREEKVYLIMDYIEGTTLDEISGSKGPPAIGSVILWGIRLCEILEYLHGQDPPVVFGDVKPSNLVLQKDKVVLVDFGSAAMLYSKGPKSGTKGYFPPWKEQTGAEMTDVSIDIYALGRTLEALAAGGGKKVRLPKEFARIVEGCTTQREKKRFRSVKECRQALEKLRCRGWTLTAATLLALCIVAAAGRAVNERQRAADIHVQYDALLSQAQRSAPQEKQELILKAISINPSCETGYLSLLDHFLEDAILSEEEDLCLRTALREVGADGRCREELLLENQSGYLKTAYEIGMAYWYFYEGEGAKAYAGSWFGKVTELEGSAALEESRYQRSRIYAEIGSYRGKLMQSKKTGEEHISYKKYWTDLLEILKMQEEEADSPVVTLHVWKELLLQMSRYTLEFQSAGVTKQEMREVIEKIGANLQEIPQGGQEIKKQKEEMKELQKMLMETLEGG